MRLFPVVTNKKYISSTEFGLEFETLKYNTGITRASPECEIA